MVPLVITTINEKTESIKAFEADDRIFPIIIGDKKGPHEFQTRGHFLSLSEQLELDSNFAKKCPTGHYARKNIGYILARKFGSELIFESDDDNCPNTGWLDSWPEMELMSNTCQVKAKTGWANIYKLFSDKKIWPRGFPLSQINVGNNFELTDSKVKIGLWQGLADGEPDVDAIYRLTNPGDTIFKTNQVALAKGTYCPINSQNTVWLSRLAPIMYLPCTVAFRYTDILRGIIAQHLLFSYGLTVGFCSANVFQQRNEHNLILDFEDEVPMYKHQEHIIETLNSIKLPLTSSDEDMVCIYNKLVDMRIVDASELKLLHAYLEDL